MLARILAFEFRYQIRQPLFWLATAVFFLLTFGAITTDAVTIGGSIGSVHRNAPFVIFQILGIMTVIGTFLTTAFVANSVHRDFESQTDALFFSLPIRKADYLFGRFGGSLLVAGAVFLGVMLAIVVGSRMPWLDPARIGPTLAGPYLQATLYFVLPNLFLTGAIFFALATLTRSLMYTYVGVVVFFTGWGIASAWLGDLENRTIGALLDPYGFGAFELLTRYWTVAERNTSGLTLSGVFLWNRLIWVGLGVLILAFTYARFRFSISATRARSRRRMVTDEDATAGGSGMVPAAASTPHAAPLPAAVQTFGAATVRRQFLHQTRIETIGVLKGIPFLIMLFAGVLNVLGSSGVVDQLFGTAVYPVTHLMLQVIQGSFGLFAFLILIFYSGDLIWRERNLRMADMTDALPVPTWAMWASKLTALGVIVAALMAAAMLTSIGIQLYHGYTHLEPALYLKGLFLELAPTFLLLAALYLFVQVVTNNKFLGWLVSAGVYIMGQVMPAMRLEHNLYRFGGTPNAPYSDMNGYGHFVQPMLWFSIYWGFVSAALVVVAHLLWVRGSESGLRIRLRESQRRLTRAATLGLAISLIGAMVSAGYIFYNTTS